MCGISGIWNANSNVSKDDLMTFTNSMEHRGPDGCGLYVDTKNNIGLGHRRLSILDLSERGKQPMAFADNKYYITYNGEIYNFIEIKQELEITGFKFNTSSDTEVLLAAYHKWGKDCLHKFNGMWAFAIWDTKEKKLFLSRDRFGIKPLYYLYIPNQIFAFASETYAFKFLNNFNRQINNEKLIANINDPYALEGLGHTIFDNIFQVLPGHNIELKQNEYPKQRRWFHILEHLQEIPKSYNEQVSEFKHLFEDACKLRLRSDVPIATALSGGLDSSSVFCTIDNFKKHKSQIARMPNNCNQAFSVIFPGTDVDEQKYVKIVEQSTKGIVNYIKPDITNFTDNLINSTIKFDAISSPIVAINSVYKAMNKKNFKVSLDGHGVDEMMFGYKKTVYDAFYASIGNGNTKQANDLLQLLNNMTNIKDCDFNNYLELIKKRSGLKSKLSYSIKHLLRIKNKSKNKKQNSLTELSDRPYCFSNSNSIEKLNYQEFFINTLPALLRNFDRASMQSSVEIRMPFMDWRLVCYVFSLPIESKLGSGFTKLILRDAMTGVLPEQIKNRTSKIGFATPVSSWFSDDVKLFLLNMINSVAFKKNIEIIKPDLLSQELQGGELNEENALKIWPYINAHLLIENNG